MVKNDTFAICGTIFTTAFAILVAFFGSETAVGMVIALLFFAALSQYVAQGVTKYHHYLSTFFAAMTFLCAIAAMVTF